MSHGHLSVWIKVFQSRLFCGTHHRMDPFLLSSSCIHIDRGSCLPQCMWTSGAWSRGLPCVPRRKMANLLTIHMCNKSRSLLPSGVPYMTYAGQDWVVYVWWDLFYLQRNPDLPTTKWRFQDLKLGSHNRKLALRYKVGAPCVWRQAWDLLGLYLACA